MKNKIKKNQEVIVIAGAHKGIKGRVISVSKDHQRIVVDKVNIVKKHQKPTQQNPDGGIKEMEAPIHVSNLKLFVKTKNKKDKNKPQQDKGKK